MIIEYAYAKVNLTLNILNKREDGYHNLKSVFIPIKLYDTLTFTKSEEYILESNFVLDVNDNLITKTFNLMKSLYNIPNCKITLLKKIPTEAGLAGGSADASATIRGLNKLFSLNLSNEQLEFIANSLGSDTLFTLYNKPALVTSRGDEISFIESNLDLNLLLIKPPYGFSTKEMFSFNFPNIPHNDEIIEEIKKNNLTNIYNLTYNSFLEKALSINPNFKQLVDYLTTFSKVNLSGSGSTLFIIDQLPNLEIIKDNINKKYPECFTLITKNYIKEEKDV